MGIFQKIRSYFVYEKNETEGKDSNLLRRKRNRTAEDLDEFEERFNIRLNDLERRITILENNNINNRIYSQNLIIDLVFLNNGSKNWPENTKLRIDRNGTNFRTNLTEINLGTLQVGQQKNIKIDADIVDKLEENKYRFALDFCVNDREFGNKIYINFQIIEDEISEDIASNTCIMKELKNNNGNFAKAYNNIINKSVNNAKKKKNDKKNN